MSAGRRRRWVGLLVSAAAAGALCTAVACDLAETTIPLGEPLVVVHAVMRPDMPGLLHRKQFVIVERSFTGDVEAMIDSATGDTTYRVGDRLTIPLGGEPSIPIEGAVVTVANLDLPQDPCGAAVSFIADPQTVQLDARPGVYWSPFDCPTMRPGDRLALRVETPDGTVVTGTTRIPGLTGARFGVGNPSAPLDTSLTTTINRDHDTLAFAVEASAGRLVQIEVRRRSDLTDVGTKIFIDTTAFRLPASLINTFVLGDDDDVFRAGREYNMTVAITDTNYFDFARSENNRYTGRGFVNHLTGGFGVFGSLASRTTGIKAVGDVDDRREGVYRMQGMVQGFQDSVPVDLTWEVYLRRSSESSEFSAFVSGNWITGPIDQSIDGRFDGRLLTGILFDSLTYAREDTVIGFWEQDQPFVVDVIVSCPPNALARQACAPERRRVGRLTAVKQ